VRDVGEQRTERHNQLHAERLGEVDDQLREAAPAHRRLRAAEQHEVARRAWHPGGEDLDRRPDDLALAILVMRHVRTRRLKIVEVLRIDAREARRPERAAEEGQRRGGGVAGVVPAGEGADQCRRAKAVRTLLP